MRMTSLCREQHPPRTSLCLDLLVPRIHGTFQTLRISGMPLLFSHVSSSAMLCVLSGILLKCEPWKCRVSDVYPEARISRSSCHSATDRSQWRHRWFALLTIAGNIPSLPMQLYIKCNTSDEDLDHDDVLQLPWGRLSKCEYIWHHALCHRNRWITHVCGFKFSIHQQIFRTPLWISFTFTQNIQIMGKLKRHGAATKTRLFEAATVQTRRGPRLMNVLAELPQTPSSTSRTPSPSKKRGRSPEVFNETYDDTLPSFQDPKQPRSRGKVEYNNGDVNLLYTLMHSADAEWLSPWISWQKTRVTDWDTPSRIPTPGAFMHYLWSDIGYIPLWWLLRSTSSLCRMLCLVSLQFSISSDSTIQWTILRTVRSWHDWNCFRSSTTQARM